MTDPLLALSGLSKNFVDKRVLNDINFSLNPREILFLLGPSGCGKTTLLRIIAGFETAGTGRMEIGGREIFGIGTLLPPQERGLGYVPQEGVLFPHMSVYRNIAYGLGDGRGKGEEERGRIEEVMRLTDIAELGARMPHEISGGQQQRVALARALAPRPAIMLLDEPFSALDEHLRTRIRDEVIDILRRSGSAAIIVTHDRREALGSADRIGIMLDGKLAQLATPEELYRRPRTPDVARFVDDCCILLPAEIDEGRLTASCRLADHIPIDQPSAGLNREGARDGQILIRGEQLRIVSPGDPGTLCIGKTVRIEFLGSISRVDVMADNITVSIVTHSGDRHPASGDIVGLALTGRATFFF